MIAKRARLMADWARFCCTPPAKARGDVVVTIRRKAAP
jgi:hypothetical protein